MYARGSNDRHLNAIGNQKIRLVKDLTLQERKLITSTDDFFKFPCEKLNCFLTKNAG